MEDIEVKRFEINTNWRSHVAKYINLKKKNKNLNPDMYCSQAKINPEGFKIFLGFLEKEDIYVFFKSFASEYLNRAMSSLNLLEKHTYRELSMPLIRDAIVAYAAPFSASNGRIITKLSLKEVDCLIPADLQEVHDKIINDRNEIIGHCDLAPRNPRLCFIGIMIKGQGYYWEDYKKILPDFKKLVPAVMDNLEKYNKIKFVSRDVYFKEYLNVPQCTEENPGPVVVDK
ncbi:MAG: hypothetical protein A2Y12_11380 [Planctomycetes bacterium GWF2_42_9]|nr:MAG: hypothetical protein A2Y12_11380 [Planctomycetes bacterium GWF2_42_9]HAL44468.1 hypothetical protein [Phycisphaerales bacterium]